MSIISSQRTEVQPDAMTFLGVKQVPLTHKAPDPHPFGLGERKAGFRAEPGFREQVRLYAFKTVLKLHFWSQSLI